MNRRPLGDRFWEKVAYAEADECWLWTGSINPAGYGQIFVETGAAPKKAHRAAWELLRGDIPEGLHLDHLCRVRHCVNPWHCDPVTNEVNTARGNLRTTTPHGRTKTHCRNGHPYDEANTYVDPSTHRRCRTCARTQGLASYHRRKSA